MGKITKMVRLANKLESKFTPVEQLKIAKKRIMRAANIDESQLEEIKKNTLGEKLVEKKEEVITKFDLLQDLKIKVKDEPDNETLENELDMKENDLEFAVEDLVRIEKDSNGEDMDIFEAKLKKAKEHDSSSTDKAKSSSKQVEDTGFKKNQKAVNENTSSTK